METFSFLEDAISYLRAGEVIAYPTETFYGLGVDPRKKKAVEALLFLKSRGLEQGMPVIADSAERIEAMIGQESGEVRARRQKLQELFWPGPLSLILSINDTFKESLHPGVFGPDFSLAVRVSPENLATELAKSIGGLLVATSANPHGEAPPLFSEKVRQYFPDMFVLAVAEENSRRSLREEKIKPSTLIDVRSIPFQVLREGAVTCKELEDFLL